MRCNATSNEIYSSKSIEIFSNIEWCLEGWLRNNFRFCKNVARTHGTHCSSNRKRCNLATRYTVPSIFFSMVNKKVETKGLK